MIKLVIAGLWGYDLFLLSEGGAVWLGWILLCRFIQSLKPDSALAAGADLQEIWSPMKRALRGGACEWVAVPRVQGVACRVLWGGYGMLPPLFPELGCGL